MKYLKSILYLFLICASFSWAVLALAQTQAPANPASTPSIPTPSAEISAYQLEIPLFDYTQSQNIAEYIAKIYEYAGIILIPILIIVILIGGLQWLSAAGDTGKIQKAKDRLISGFIGLGLALSSYLILSLLGLNILQMPAVQYIEPIKGDILIIDGQQYSVAQGMSKLPPERRGNISAFNNAGCPKGQTSFQVFFTNYYKPTYGESYGNNDFFCNVGMQCTCPNGKDNSRNCNYGRVYHPCAYFSSSTPYCNKGSGGKEPVANYTVAADSGCFRNSGCKFKIQGSTNTYEIQDTGSWIHGTHMDLFVGPRNNINNIAGVYTIQLVDPNSCF